MLPPVVMNEIMDLHPNCRRNEVIMTEIMREESNMKTNEASGKKIFGGITSDTDFH